MTRAALGAGEVARKTHGQPLPDGRQQIMLDRVGIASTRVPDSPRCPN